MNPIPYGKQNITEEDIQEVVSVLKSDFLTQGPEIAEFEKAFAAYAGSDYAVAVANGTAALHLSAMALGVKPSAKVITTPITFVASANCVRYCGGDVVFSDIDPETYLLDINKLSQLLESNPKDTFSGIIPVDFAGYPVHLDELRQLADKYGLWILEDACHAPGAFFTDKQGKKRTVGDASLADISIFSFHPVKHIAAGEGGMITCNDEQLYNKLMDLRTHGITKNPEKLQDNHGAWYYEMYELGYNYRMTDIQAALAKSQLKRANENLEKRHRIAKRYDIAFKDTPVKTPFVDSNSYHGYHLYIIGLKNRDDMYYHLRQNNIFPQIHYIPVHLQPYYRNLGWRKGDMPCAENYYQQCLSLPMYPSLTEEEQDYVIEKVMELLS